MTRTVITTPRGSVGSLGDTKVVVTIPAVTTQTVDQVNAATTRCVKWILAITNTTTNQIITEEITVINANVGLTHSRYNIIGDIIPHTIQVSLLSGNIHLIITNPTANAYLVNSLRIEIA